MPLAWLVSCGFGFRDIIPRGSIYTTIMELGPQNHSGDGLLGPNSIIVVYVDPLGLIAIESGKLPCRVELVFRDT